SGVKPRRYAAPAGEVAMGEAAVRLRGDERTLDGIGQGGGRHRIVGCPLVLMAKRPDAKAGREECLVIWSDVGLRPPALSIRPIGLAEWRKGERCAADGQYLEEFAHAAGTRTRQPLDVGDDLPLHGCVAAAPQRRGAFGKAETE